MAMKSMKTLLDQIAEYMGNENRARAALENLDNRAYKMQGSEKAWARNADKFNSRAQALEAKANWNKWQGDKLKKEKLDRVNEANNEYNNQAWKAYNKENEWLDAIEQEDRGSYGNYNSRFTKESLDDIFNDRHHNGSHIGKYDISNSNQEYKNALGELEDGVGYERADYEKIRKALKYAERNNTLDTYPIDYLDYNGKAVKSFQKGGPRYRK